MLLFAFKSGIMSITQNSKLRFVRSGTDHLAETQVSYPIGLFHIS